MKRYIYSEKKINNDLEMARRDILKKLAVGTVFTARARYRVDKATPRQIEIRKGHRCEKVSDNKSASMVVRILDGPCTGKNIVIPLHLLDHEIFKVYSQL